MAQNRCGARLRTHLGAARRRTHLGAALVILTLFCAPAWGGGASQEGGPAAGPLPPTHSSTLQASMTPNPDPRQALAGPLREDGARDAFPAIAGRWGQLLVQTSVTRVPMVGRVTSTTRTLLLLDITQEGADLEIETRVCSIEIANRPNLVRTIIPEAFVASLERTRRRARLRLEANGFSLEQPRFTEVLGARLGDPLRDPLPQDPSDPRVYDQDRSGHPGLTVEIEGVVRGEVYVVQRAWNQLRSTHLSTSRIDGLVEWDNEQVVLGASNAFIRRDAPASPHPDAGLSWFRTERMSRSATCADLRAQSRSLFAR